MDMSTSVAQNVGDGKWYIYTGDGQTLLLGPYDSEDAATAISRQKQRIKLAMRAAGLPV